MNFAFLCSLLALAVLGLIHCQRAGAQHKEKCRRQEAERRLRELQQKFFTTQKELIKTKKENLRLSDLDSDRCRTIGQSAHELRNPINALDSVFNLLEVELKGNQGPSPAVCQNLFGVASEAIASMQVEIQKVTDVRSNQIAKESATRSPVELNALLRKTISQNEALATQRNLTIQLIDSNRPRIWADQDRCLKILDNLLKTTLEQAPTGSEVRLQVENPQMHEVALSIETLDQPLPDFISEFFENKQTEVTATPSDPHERGRATKLAKACEDVKAQKGSLEAKDGKRLTLRFPHVRILTRNPFFEIKDTQTEPALEAMSV